MRRRRWLQVLLSQSMILPSYCSWLVPCHWSILDDMVVVTSLCQSRQNRMDMEFEHDMRWNRNIPDLLSSTMMWNSLLPGAQYRNLSSRSSDLHFHCWIVLPKMVPRTKELKPGAWFQRYSKPWCPTQGKCSWQSLRNSSFC